MQGRTRRDARRLRAPYCEGADIKPALVEWREVSLKQTPGSTPREYHYETYYLAPKAKFSFKDVVRVQAGETYHEAHLADGSVKRDVLPTVTFELAPATLESMKAWTRALEKRNDGYATLQDGKLLFIDRRAMVDDSSPGIADTKIDEYCTKTMTRTLPSID